MLELEMLTFESLTICHFWDVYLREVLCKWDFALRELDTLPANGMFTFFRCLPKMSLIPSQCLKGLPVLIFFTWKKFCILPVYERFTCLRCFSSRELATLQVFEMLSCLRCLPEIERAGHFASVWDVYLRKSWALCPCIRCLPVWDVFTKRGRERVGHFASDWDGYLFEIMQDQEICVLCKCLRC